MYTKKSKKLLIICILDILKKYTDENHRISQKQIADILKNEYEMTVDRKSIKRNIMELIDFGYEIEYSETIRMMPNIKTGELEESNILSDFYIVRNFTDWELRLLIDSILFAKHIPNSQCKKMIDKLEGLSSKYFKTHVKYVRAVPNNSIQNKQLFFTIEILDEAINTSKQVSFTYNEYNTDKRLCPRLDTNGKPRKYIINPYQIVTANGWYYLICNNEKYDDVSNYRLDRITDIELLDTQVKSTKKVKQLEHGLNLPKHMAEHIYMFTGESAAVTFRLKKFLLTEVIDWFGKDISFSDETKEEVTAKVYVNLMAMRKWALQYSLYTKILSPKSLRENVLEDIKKAMENYND